MHEANSHFIFLNDELSDHQSNEFYIVDRPFLWNINSLRIIQIRYLFTSGRPITPTDTRQHKFYCGIDLHTNKMYLCILDETGEIIFEHPSFLLYTLVEKWQRHPVADLRGYKPLLQFTIFSSNKSVNYFHLKMKDAQNCALVLFEFKPVNPWFGFGHFHHDMITRI